MDEGFAFGVGFRDAARWEAHARVRLRSIEYIQYTTYHNLRPRIITHGVRGNGLDHPRKATMSEVVNVQVERRGWRRRGPGRPGAPQRRALDDLPGDETVFSEVADLTHDSLLASLPSSKSLRHAPA